jgi:hypothetical protein
VFPRSFTKLFRFPLPFPFPFRAIDVSPFAIGFRQVSVRCLGWRHHRQQLAPGQTGDIGSRHPYPQMKGKHQGRHEQPSAGQHVEKRIRADFGRDDLGGFPVVSAKAVSKSMAFDREVTAPVRRPFIPRDQASVPSHPLTCLSTYADSSSGVNFRLLPTRT